MGGVVWGKFVTCSEINPVLYIYLRGIINHKSIKMKKSIAFLALFLLSLGISAQQTFMLQPTIIHPEDAQDFEMIQKNMLKD